MSCYECGNRFDDITGLIDFCELIDGSARAHMRELLEGRGVTPAERAVGNAMLDRMDVCHWPHRVELLHQTDLSAAAITKALKRLVAKGLFAEGVDYVPARVRKSREAYDRRKARKAQQQQEAAGAPC